MGNAEANAGRPRTVTSAGLQTNRRGGAVYLAAAPRADTRDDHPTAHAMPTPRSLTLAAALAAAALLALPAGALYAWGERGHYLTGQAAAAALPAAMPAFFRAAAPELAYLNPEPDRWKDRGERKLDPALDAAYAADHFIDMELIPAARMAGAMAAPDRYAYADTLRAIGVAPADVGMLPFRIVEMTQRLRVEFRLWRRAPNDAQRAWIEHRIVNDAGLLGHYVADGSNPAHTTVQYNGWTGPNPNGYATDDRFHSRFESAYVQSHIAIGDVQPLVDTAARAVPAVRPAVLEYLRSTHAEVEHLYRLDKATPFGAATGSADGKAFTAARLAAGSRMLRDLWWTAWVTSADSGAPGAGAR